MSDDNMFDDLLVKIGSGATPWKNTVRVVADAPITLAGVQTIDSVLLQVGDSVAVIAQANARDNGVYKVASASWTRRLDFGESQYIHVGSCFTAMEGTVHGGNLIKMTSPTNGPIRVGYSPLVFADVGPVGTGSVFSPGQAEVAYAATVELDFEGVTDITISPLTAGIAIDPPVNAIGGAIYTVKMTQDAGGFNLATWDAAWVFPDGLGLPCLRGNESTTWTFRYDAGAGEMHCIGRTYSIGYVSFTSGAPNLVPGIVNILSGTVADPQLPDGADWGGMANAITVKLAGLTGGCDVTPGASETINDGAAGDPYTIAEEWGQVVIMSRGTTALLASPGLS